MPFGALVVDQLLLEPNIFLAPMSGVTSSAFRRLLKRQNPSAIGLVFTEFVSVEGLVRRNSRSRDLMNFHAEESPVAVQVFGRDIAHMAEAAAMAEQAGAALVDINCGCPVPKVVKRGGGCELMRSPQHLGSLVSAVRKAIKVPLGVKIRSGWDRLSRNAVQIARICEENGASIVTIHARTRQDGYQGRADWDLIAEVVSCVSIPVVGNGDVVDYRSAEQGFQQGVRGLMIGRAALANPWVFREIQAGFHSTEALKPEKSDIVQLLEDYRNLLLEEMPEKAAIGRLKFLSCRLAKGFPGAASLREMLCQAPSVAVMSELILAWKEGTLA